MTSLLSLLWFEARQAWARRWCGRHGHPDTIGDYPPICTKCGRWVR